MNVANTCVSSPTVIIIIKKSTAHNCGTGIFDIASGYAMNISPGPANKDCTNQPFERYSPPHNAKKKFVIHFINDMRAQWNATYLVAIHFVRRWKSKAYILKSKHTKKRKVLYKEIKKQTLTFHVHLKNSLGNFYYFTFFRQSYNRNIIFTKSW